MLVAPQPQPGRGHGRAGHRPGGRRRPRGQREGHHQGGYEQGPARSRPSCWPRGRRRSPGRWPARPCPRPRLRLRRDPTSSTCSSTTPRGWSTTWSTPRPCVAAARTSATPSVSSPCAVRRERLEPARYPHLTGVRSNVTGADRDHPVGGFPALAVLWQRVDRHQLDPAGCRGPGFIGKFMNGYEHPARRAGGEWDYPEVPGSDSSRPTTPTPRPAGASGVTTSAAERDLPLHGARSRSGTGREPPT